MYVCFAAVSQDDEYDGRAIKRVGLGAEDFSVHLRELIPHFLVRDGDDDRRLCAAARGAKVPASMILFKTSSDGISGR